VFLNETVTGRVWDCCGISYAGRSHSSDDANTAYTDCGRSAMTRFFEEYGEMIVASAGALLMFLLFRMILLSPSGEFAQLVLLLEEGGI
jgi:hypothetical protein